MNLYTSSKHKDPLDNYTEAMQSLSELKRKIKQQAIFNASIIFVIIPSLIFGVRSLIS